MHVVAWTASWLATSTPTPNPRDTVELWERLPDRVSFNGWLITALFLVAGAVLGAFLGQIAASRSLANQLQRQNDQWERDQQRQDQERGEQRVRWGEQQAAQASERQAQQDRWSREEKARELERNAQQKRWEAAYEADTQRLMTDRFGRAAAQLGDHEPAVRLAGVYAMATLADDWKEQRQQCVDVLCGYMRLEPRADVKHRTAGGWQLGEKEVRATLTGVIREHLQEGATPSWGSLDFDFRGALFLGVADFFKARFARNVSFERARFLGEARFDDAEFPLSLRFNRNRVEWLDLHVAGVSFSGATFEESVSFSGAKFEGAWFTGAKFFADAWFDDTTIGGRRASFRGVRFAKGASFRRAKFVYPEADFRRAEFSTSKVYFDRAVFYLGASFQWASLAGPIDLTSAEIKTGPAVPRFTYPDGTQTRDLPVIPATAPQPDKDNPAEDEGDDAEA